MDIQRDENGVKKERSGWRDEQLSRQHRTWGRDLTATNADAIYSRETTIEEGESSVFVEIQNKNEPVLITDYKRMERKSVDWNSSALGCLQVIANRCQCAVTVVFYGYDPYWWFAVVPGNTIAALIYTKFAYLSEFEYVATLYQLRGLVMPSHIARNLSKKKRGS